MVGDSLGSCHEIGIFATRQPGIEVLTRLKQRPVGTVAEDFQSLNEFARSCHRVIADLNSLSLSFVLESNIQLANRLPYASAEDAKASAARPTMVFDPLE